MAASFPLLNPISNTLLSPSPFAAVANHWPHWVDRRAQPLLSRYLFQHCAPLQLLPGYHFVSIAEHAQRRHRRLPPSPMVALGLIQGACARLYFVLNPKWFLSPQRLLLPKLAPSNHADHHRLLPRRSPARGSLMPEVLRGGSYCFFLLLYRMGLKYHQNSHIL